MSQRGDPSPGFARLNAGRTAVPGFFTRQETFMKRRSMSTACTILMIGGALSYAIVFGTVVTRAQALCCAIEPLIRGPQSLKGVPVPEPPDLGNFVTPFNNNLQMPNY